MDAKQLRETADNLFGKRTTLNLLWQEIADNFYVERADFAYQRYIGMDFAAHLSTSYPMMVRRDLGNQLGAMLRPSETPWFHIGTKDPRKETIRAKRWLEWSENVMRRAMYDRASLFTRATKEGDHDYAAFGQCVLSLRLNSAKDGLLYRCWHLRDVAWEENADGRIGSVYRKWKPTARNLVQTFPGKLDERVVKIADKEPFTEMQCMHIMVEADMYDGPLDTDAGSSPAMMKRRRERFPYVSIYYDCSHDKVIEAMPSASKEYIIPRWQTVSGSQYAFSPATTMALPDGRLLQSMTHTILEAGEKAAYPPMVVTENAVRAEVPMYAGALIWVAEEYDERTGAAVRPLEQDMRGLPVGKEMIMDAREVLRSIFYLDKLSLPVNNPQMTAYEAGQRVAEYIRSAMPIFEPMEQDYNGAVCEETFALLKRFGTFASMDMPAELQDAVLGDAGITFKFQSPLHDAIEQQKVQKFLQARSLIAQVVQEDPSTAFVMNAQVALREALLAGGTPATWVRTQEETDAINQEMAKKQQDAEDMQKMQQASTVALNLAGAQKASNMQAPLPNVPAAAPA